MVPQRAGLYLVCATYSAVSSNALFTECRIVLGTECKFKGTQSAQFRGALYTECRVQACYIQNAGFMGSLPTKFKGVLCAEFRGLLCTEHRV